MSTLPTTNETNKNYPGAIGVLELMHQYQVCSRARPLQIPNRQVVAQITDLLLDVLFPEIRMEIEEREGGEDQILKAIEETGREISDLLVGQVAIALLHRIMEGEEKQLSAEDIVSQVLGRLGEIRQMAWEDAEAAFRGDPAAKGPEEVILTYPSYIAITTYRIAHALHELGVPFIPRMMTEQAHRETGIDIHPGAKIGKEFFIDHGTGVVIGATAEIGDRVKLYQGVTLGALSFATDGDGNMIRDTKRHPTIGDRVVIYANATVLGGNTVVGNGSVIGSSVWLTQSVEPDSVVTMPKPQLRVRSNGSSDSV